MAAAKALLSTTISSKLRLNLEVSKRGGSILCQKLRSNFTQNGSLPTISSFVGKTLSNDPLLQYKVLNTKRYSGTVVNMAWGGTLSAVRLIVQGKHMEVSVC